MTIHTGRGRVEFFNTNEAPFRGVDMPRENCCIYLSHRHMQEFLRAVDYLRFSTMNQPRFSNRGGDSLWGFPVIVTEAAREPVMMIRWGDRSATRSLTVEQLAMPGVLNDTMNLLEQDVIASAQRAHTESYLEAHFAAEDRIRAQNAEWARSLDATFVKLCSEKKELRTVVNRRAAIRTLVFEKET